MVWRFRRKRSKKRDSVLIIAVLFTAGVADPKLYFLEAYMPVRKVRPCVLNNRFSCKLVALGFHHRLADVSTGLLSQQHWSAEDGPGADTQSAVCQARAGTTWNNS